MKRTRRPRRPTPLSDPLTTGQVAKLVGVSVGMVVKWCDSGRLKSYLVPMSTHRRITRAALVAFAREHGLPLPAELGETLVTQGED